MDRNGQRTWLFLAGISVASTLGLAAAVLPLLESRIESPWPWAHTQRVLLLAFPVTVLASRATPVVVIPLTARRGPCPDRFRSRRCRRARSRAERGSRRFVRATSRNDRPC